MMETDVTLFNPNRQEKLILDAKFYREALVSKFGGREKVRRDHLSQILSYVMNQEDRSKPHTMNACGALVYPTVDEDFDFEEAIRDIQVELEYLNTEASHLANTIQFNFKEFGI